MNESLVFYITVVFLCLYAILIAAYIYTVVNGFYQKRLFRKRVERDWQNIIDSFYFGPSDPS